APARPYQEHAILHYRVVITPDLRHAGGDLARDRLQLDAGRQFGPDIRGRLVLERLVDGTVLILRKHLEGAGNGDELVVGRVLWREFCRDRIGIRRGIWN